MRAFRSVSIAAAAVAFFALSGCATAPVSNSPVPSTLGTVSPVPPDGEVRAMGTVLDSAGDVRLCLGPVAESYPPQCSGMPVAGWTWDGVEGAESSGEVTWGSYAVTGIYDGETFTVMQPPIMLALYDPLRPDDPTGGEAGAGDEETLALIQTELPELLGDAYLSSYPEDGWLWVDVVWDDGSWQDAANAAYGDDIVVIRSAIQPLDG